MKRRSSNCWSVGLAAILLAVAPSFAYAKVVLVAGCSQIKGALPCEIEDHFAALVKEKSNGELLVDMHYASLGVEQQLAQSVMNGSVDIGQISNGNAARFTSALLLWDLPFLFDKYEQALDSLKTPIGQRAVAQFNKDLGVKLLIPLSAGGGRDLQTRTKLLRSPADIRGLKMRAVSSPVELATFRAWGANPTPIDYSQTAAAVRQGVVEGMEAPMQSVLAEKLYDNGLKFNTRLDFQNLFNLFFINQAKLSSLSPADQKTLIDAAEETTSWQRGFAAKEMAHAQKSLEKLGVRVYTPTADEMKQWRAVREEVWQEVAGQSGGKIDLKQAKELSESFK
jgi:TRAP-type C4-dicarboxylate transport system substrate-binding protein